MGQPEHGRLEQRAAPEIVDDDRAVRVGEACELDRVGRLDEAGLGEVRRVDAEDDRRAAVGQGRLEVARACPVGGADLDEPGTGPAHDLGDPHATADLDQLAARDRDPVFPGQPDRQCDGRRVVDRDQRILGPGQRDEVLLGDPEARSATTASRSSSSSE